MKTLKRLLPAALTAAAVALAATSVQAFPDAAARVDQQIRPNFGGLITPPLKPRWRPDRWKPGKYRWGQPRPGWNDYYPPDGYWPRDLQTATVDCGDPNAGPTPVSDALRSLADGGILYIRSRGGVCRETVIVEYPVTIAAEGASIFDPAPSTAPATIAAPEGAPCIRVAEGVRGVELRDLVLTSEKGGRTACIESWGGDVALVRTTVNYWGDAAAVYASGGKLIMRDSFIDAHTWDAAVSGESVQLDIARTRILGEETGIDVTPANNVDSLIDQTGIISRSTSGSAGNGLLVRGLRSGSGSLNIRNTVICGWRNGLHLDRGSQVDISRSRICRTTVGVVSDGRLSIHESAIGSQDVGVYVAGGHAKIYRNRIHDWSRRPIWIEYGATAEIEDNWVYYGGDCWRQTWDRGTYCVRSSSLPWSLRDDSWMQPSGRNWWDYDGYDRGYSRDGAPGYLPPAAPPPAPKKGWRRAKPPAGYQPAAPAPQGY